MPTKTEVSSGSLEATHVQAHTPGPWVARLQTNVHGADLGWIIEHSNGRIGWASLAYADMNDEAGKDDPARDANARLIAAAPDMLAALQAICATASDLTEDVLCEFANDKSDPTAAEEARSMLAARAALSRATGEAA
jgi:hypothetical protein